MVKPAKGTTTLAFIFREGVMVAADSRASMGGYIWIRVQSLKQDQIMMDIDLRWGGDPDISLAVEAALVASIPIQLKDLQVFTVVRAIFQLADEIPCISAVVVALLAEVELAANIC